jgi:hypothetical protein
MADERDTKIRDIKAVEREYFAVRFSVDRSLQQVRQDPTILTGDLRVREIEYAVEHLEGTYIIRLFAEFETAIRTFSQKVRGRPPTSKTHDLLKNVASRLRIPPEDLSNAQAVRAYRNDLVHLRVKNKKLARQIMAIGEARGHLCRYFSRLPRDW